MTGQQTFDRRLTALPGKGVPQDDGPALVLSIRDRDPDLAGAGRAGRALSRIGLDLNGEAPLQRTLLDH